MNPVYPSLARQTKISGTVTFHARLGSDGSVSHLELILGHPLLVKAALDAVKQWKYEPTKLNGDAVEIDTTIDVIFSLQDKPAASSTPTTKTKTARWDGEPRI